MIKKLLAKVAMLSLLVAMAVFVGCETQDNNPTGAGGTGTSNSQTGGGESGEAGTEDGDENGGYWTDEVPLS